VLVDHPRFAGVSVARPAERDDAGNEEQDVQREVERRLQARREEAVQHVAADVAVLRQRIGARHHEQRAVHHDHRVKRPRVRRSERVAREHFPGDEQGQRDDQPGKDLPDHGAHLVDEEEESLHGSNLRGCVG
jgi:hypothetical protein